MLPRTVVLPLAWLVALLLGAMAPLVAQEVAPQEALPKPKLADEDIAKFEKLYDEAIDKGDVASTQALKDAIDAYAKDKGVASPLADDLAWQKMYERHFTQSLGKGRVSGAGLVREDRYDFNDKGDWIVFEWAYVLPDGYTHEKSWPLVLCLHDVGSSGKDYLKKIWQAAKEDKDLSAGFILVAPNIGEKSEKGRSIKGERNAKSKEVRFDWFSKYHALAMLLPIREARKQFNVDPARVFVEGVGKGAEAAVHLAALYGEDMFAGFVSRHGQPVDFQVTAGLKGTPGQFLYREGGPLDEGDAKSLWGDLSGVFEKEAIQDIAIKTLPAVDKLTSRGMGGQETDPLLEANADIVAFYGSHALAAYPPELRIVTNHNLFTKRAWVKLTKHDIHEKAVVDCTVKVDKEANAVRVTGTNFYGFTLFLNDSLLDLSRTVEVYVNDVLASRSIVERSLNYMLRQMRGLPFSFNRVTTAALTVDDFPQPDEGQSTGGEVVPGNGGEKK